MDKLLYKEEHYGKAEMILEKINKNHRVITIGGGSGTGKTEVGTIIAKRLGYKLISLENYYIMPLKLRTAWRRENIENIGVGEINWSRVIVDYMCCEGGVVIEGLYANAFRFGDISFHLSGSPESSYGFRKERLKHNPDCRFRKIVVDREYEEVGKLVDLADFVV